MLLGYFNTTPEVFKVIQSDRTSDYITKNEFHGVTRYLILEPIVSAYVKKNSRVSFISGVFRNFINTTG